MWPFLVYHDTPDTGSWLLKPHRYLNWYWSLHQGLNCDGIGFWRGGQIVSLLVSVWIIGLASHGSVPGGFEGYIYEQLTIVT